MLKQVWSFNYKISYNYYRTCDWSLAHCFLAELGLAPTLASSPPSPPPPPPIFDVLELFILAFWLAGVPGTVTWLKEDRLASDCDCDSSKLLLRGSVT